MPRLYVPGMPQHVIQRGVDRAVLFVTPDDYRFFWDLLREACAKYGCHVHAYVFMTNHVHLLMTPTTASGVSRVMQSACGQYAQRFNAIHDRSGALCESRYRATIVHTDEYLFTCHRYIELNPVRAGLARQARDYPWSSHRANAFGALDVLVAPHERYVELGPDPRTRRLAYRAFFAEELSATTLTDIRDATNGGWALGSKKFRDSVAALLARRAQPATRGRRPHKKDEIGV